MEVSVQGFLCLPNKKNDQTTFLIAHLLLFIPCVLPFSPTNCTGLIKAGLNIVIDQWEIRLRQKV